MGVSCEGVSRGCPVRGQGCPVRGQGGAPSCEGSGGPCQAGGDKVLLPWGPCPRCPPTARPQAGTARPAADPAHRPFRFRNKQRMYFALKSLLQEAQNNLKIFKVRGASVLWLSHNASCSAPGRAEAQGGPSDSIPGAASPRGVGSLTPWVPGL